MPAYGLCLQSDTIQKFLSRRAPVVLTGGQIAFTLDYNSPMPKSGLQLIAAVPNVLLSGLSFDGKKNLFNGTVKLDAASAPAQLVLSGWRPATAPSLGLNAAMPRLNSTGPVFLSSATEPGIKLADVALRCEPGLWRAQRSIWAASHWMAPNCLSAGSAMAG